MVSIAKFLDTAKQKAGIESDYRLAKILGITHGAMTNYRTNRNLPDERTIEKLCIYTGDDPDVISAQLQSMRARTEEGRKLWERVARRLSVQGYRLEIADS